MIKAAWLACASLAIFSGQPAQAQESRVKISITINNDRVITATMEDNETARDFVALLPLTLALDDYNKTEKVSDLPKKLTKQDAPAASTPQTGDISYYAPWGNLAIFYRNFGHSPGLIKLGRIDSGVDALNISGPIKASIEVLKQPRR